jgi:plastocyanin
VKKLSALIAALAVAAVFAVPALAGTTTVKTADNYYVHRGGVPVVTVSQGTTVDWVWKHTESFHNVVVDTGPQHFKSKTKAKGSYSHKMTKRGTYLIVCTLHPGMTMKLKVK